MSATALAPKTVAPQATTSSTLVVRHLKKRYGTRTVVKDCLLYTSDAADEHRDV